MADLVIAPIVEGHGEVAALPILLRRVWTELLGRTYIEVIPPIRQPRFRLVSETGSPLPGLAKAVHLARLKLSQHTGKRVVFVMLDSERICPKAIAPGILSACTPSPPGMELSVVLPHIMYESWFVASSASLGEYLECSGDHPTDPEGASHGKGWIKSRMRSGAYSETVDQPPMSSAIDLELCRSRSPSFDKLCRELHRWT